jgi:hypothetical protein
MRYPMKVILQSKGIMNPPQELEADSVVVTTDSGMPVAIALGIDGNVWVSNANDEQFPELLSKLGMDKRRPELKTISVKS